MHVYVQKSTRTTIPRRSASFSGLELSHAVAPSNAGSRDSCTTRASPRRVRHRTSDHPGPSVGLMAVTRPPVLRGRDRECAALVELLETVRGGASGVLVVRGEAGIGKSTLLRYCADQAADCHVVQIVGVESELEMPFAALHQLCGPMLGHSNALPAPQERALEVAFGLATGDPPDLFVVGLAALSLLADAAAKQPIVCLVDDAQWLDEASARVLGFVGRRLLAESVLLVFAVREGGDARLLPALTAMTLAGLADDDAGALLTAASARRLDARVRDRIVAETRGNPLALLAAAEQMSDAAWATGFAATAPVLPEQLEDHYVQRLRALPQPVQRLLVLAAADPTGDAPLLWRAVQILGIGRDAAAIAESEGLLHIGVTVRFRHPLVRSTAYAVATPEDRRAAHLALADATDEQADPERRVWHLAAAATGPDEDLAMQLERMASTARARGGLAGAAAFLQRSSVLTAEPTRRAGRALAAAQAHVQTGALEVALGLLAESAGLAT